jgi:hypothetical protein
MSRALAVTNQQSAVAVLQQKKAALASAVALSFNNGKATESEKQAAL